jgi:hypothetical protein
MTESIVDIRSTADGKFGNSRTNVDTKDRDSYALGFVRVRKRALKGGHPSSRTWRRAADTVAGAGTTFDVVRAIRVNGKPRQKYVLGLGTVKDKTQLVLAACIMENAAQWT